MIMADMFTSVDEKNKIQEAIDEEEAKQRKLDKESGIKTEDKKEELDPKEEQMSIIKSVSKQILKTSTKFDIDEFSN